MSKELEIEQLISSKIIAENCGVQHKNVRQHIKRNKKTLEKLGKIKLIKEGKNGTRNYHVYYNLNKKQVSFLLSKMSRSDNRDKFAKKLGIDFQIVGNRLENNFKQILLAILKGFSNELVLESQVDFNGYLIDYVIYEKINNDKYICLLIEYDEKIHKYNKLKDKIREENIMNYIFKNSDDEIVSIYRVKEGEELKAISDIIMFLTNEQALEIQDYEKLTDVETYHRYNMDDLAQQ